jgi:Ca2+-binding RTX toxin-like protein
MTKYFNGTRNDDNMVGTDINSNIFQGSTGNDIMLGLAGHDVVDYSNLGHAVTMLPQGVMKKGVVGTDQLSSVEEVIGAVGHANTIDASGVGYDNGVSLYVNLATNELNVKNIPYVGNLNLTIKHFVNVLGSENADIIIGDAQNNNLQGNNGNDIIDGGAGKNTIDGGAGNDSLVGGKDEDTLIGGNGNDILKGGAGNDVLNGGAGNDSLSGNEGNDVLNGGNGNDSLLGNEGNDVINGGDGNDTLIGGIDNDALFGGNGDDYLQGDEGNDFLDGGAGNDYVDGGVGDDYIKGSAGNDILAGLAGYDVVDYSQLGKAMTMLPGGLMQKGTLSKDQMYGIEEVIGAVGYANTIDASGVKSGVSMNVNLEHHQAIVKNVPYVGDQHLTVKNFVNVLGTENADTIVGDAKNNTLQGNAGDDTLNGAAGNDTLLGGLGNDSLLGGAGNDLLQGTDGRTAGAGQKDYLFGGTGADTFVLADAEGGFYGRQGEYDYAVIRDFTAHEDKVQLSDDVEYRLINDHGTSYLYEYTDNHWDTIAILENTQLNQHDLNNHELFQYV